MVSPGEVIRCPDRYGRETFVVKEVWDDCIHARLNHENPMARTFHAFGLDEIEPAPRVRVKRMRETT